MEEQPVFPILGKTFLWCRYLLWSSEHSRPYGCSVPGEGAVLQLEFLGRHLLKASIGNNHLWKQRFSRTKTWFDPRVAYLCPIFRCHWGCLAQIAPQGALRFLKLVTRAPVRDVLGTAGCMVITCWQALSILSRVGNALRSSGNQSFENAQPSQSISKAAVI